MKTVEIIKAVNDLSDETETNNTIINFLNDAMSKINIARNSGLPYLKLSTTDDEPVFSEKWQRALLIPFAVGRVKQKDSSQFEYEDAYREFESELATFKQKYNIPTIYKCLVSDKTITLANGTEYEVQEDDTLASISLAHDNMNIKAIIDANKKLHYVEDGIPSDIYSVPPFPFHSNW